jgi:hypothetical protein
VTLPAGAEGEARAKAQGDPAGHSVQPAGERLTTADRPGLAHQGEESGLEGVLGIVGTIQDAVAGTQHQPLVPPDQQLESVRVALGQEAFQQLGVGGRGLAALQDAAQSAQDGGTGGRWAWHSSP